MSKCYVVDNPTYVPAMRLILSVTNSYPATVTTSLDNVVAGNHGYSTGLIVRTVIPIACGMQELNNFVGEIVVTGPTTFTIDVDTTRFGVFAIPALPNPPWANTCAQVSPVGENNSMLTQATRNNY